MVWSPLQGDIRSSHGISAEDEMVTLNIDSQASTPISHPQSYDLAISSMRWGWGYHGWYYPSSFTSVIITTASRTLMLTSARTLIPLNWTFHPWSSKDALLNLQRNAQSFLFTQPRGVSIVCCWRAGRQFTLCCASSISLPSRVCSSRVVVVHLAHSACTPTQRGYPLWE